MDEKQLVDGTTALAEKQPRVIKIEPAERPQNVRLRVAAYTRVSSDSEDQLNSFAAQNRYYTELISGKAEWRMVDIYRKQGTPTARPRASHFLYLASFRFSVCHKQFYPYKRDYPVRPARSSLKIRGWCYFAAASSQTRCG